MKWLTIPILFFTSFITLSITEVDVNPISIYIDPGHGGIDTGTSANGVHEAALNLEISKVLQEVLLKRGYQVYMTREDDSSLCQSEKFIKKEDLNNRIDQINKSDCDLFISIHQNHYSNPIYKGAQVFYFSNNTLNQTLANSIQNVLKLRLNTKRNEKEISSIYLLKNITKAGCLIECGFMSNEEEFKKLNTKEYQFEISYAILEGIELYLQRNYL